MEDCTIIIPTLNEAENIGELLNILTSYYPKSNIIVADDGSSDSTQDIVMEHSNKNITLLDRSKEDVKGLTASVLDAARLVNTPNVVIMDADLQHPPEKVKELNHDLRFNDISIGYRKAVANEWPLHRKMMSWGGDALARIRLMMKPFTCLDLMTGFFGIRTAVMMDILAAREKSFVKPGYKVLFELLKYAPDGVRLGHVPYVFGERLRGDSKIGNKHIYYHMKSVAKK